jgi:tripartite ATP-independent transporter DctP family solute receptor
MADHGVQSFPNLMGELPPDQRCWINHKPTFAAATHKHNLDSQRNWYNEYVTGSKWLILADRSTESAPLLGGTIMLNYVARAALPLLVSGFLASAAVAQDIREHSIKFGYSVHEVHPLGQGANKFISLVDQKSGGKIKVRAYPATQLGSETQMISATQGGVQELVGVSSAPLVGLVKEFAVFDFPFLFANDKEADAVVGGDVGQALLGKLADKSLVGLCFWENGFRHVTNSKRPIATATDISGLKVRTMQNPVYIDAFSTLGANAVPMPWPEVYTALESGAIDAQENPYGIIHANKLNEVQKYLSVTKHGYSPYVLMASKKFWDGLNPAEQKIFQESCDEARAFQLNYSRGEDKKLIEELKQRGMTINELSPDEIAKIKEKLQPVTDKYVATISPDLVEKLRESLAKAK